MTRLEQLHAFLLEDPDDPFTLYALATEYLKTDVNQALAYYEKLLAEHPNYVGTYYHAARLYADLGRADDAQKTYRKGLEVSQAAGNRNAHRELQAAYQQFLDE
ncbi:MAG: tetratricopeptide repeat protein [Cytophagales bacterium]|nr:tetratricopeptide repeat protein [Cytophagales bacterium]